MTVLEIGSRTPKAGAITGAELEIFRARLTGLVDEISLALARSAYSVNIKTRFDFACALFDPIGRVVAQSVAVGQPGFVGAFVVHIRRFLAELQGEQMEPDDHFVSNNPHLGMTHLPDVTVLSPLFFDNELIAYAASVAHHGDMGGWAAGGWVSDATELVQEGILINPTKLASRGHVNKAILRLIVDNTRTPEQNIGDFTAQMSVGRVAQRRLSEIVATIGAHAYADGVESLFDYCERRMRAAVRRLPEQLGEGETTLDNVGETSEAIRIHASARRQGDGLVIDLSQSSPQVAGSMNCTLGQAYTCAFYAVKALTDPSLPVNDGSYRVVELIAPEGLVVNPRPGAAVSVGWETATRVTDVVLSALGGGEGERAVAESKGTMGVMGYGGSLPDHTGMFAFFEAVGGGYGARGDIDGVDGVQAHVQNTADAQVEEVEAYHPLRVIVNELAPDTEGAGRVRGGLGICKEVEFLVDGMWSAPCDRRESGPQGLDGGQSGAPQRYESRVPGSIEWKEVRGKQNIRVTAGTVVRIVTPGGGGIGDAVLRDRGAVLADVRDGRISTERASAVYKLDLDLEDGESL